MSVLTTVARIALMWRNFATESGLRIEKAHDRIPRIIQPAELPGVMIFPSPATYNYDQYGEQVVSETRQYRSMLCVSAASLGNIETGQDFVENYFTPVRDYFAARPGLEDDTAADTPGNRQTVVARARLISDGGYILFEWPSAASGGSPALFHAIEFIHEVEELAHIEYQD